MSMNSKFFSGDFVLPYGLKTVCDISFPAVGLTKQSMKDECDVNLILAKYQRTGVIDFINKHEPRYGNASPIDFQTAMNVVIEGKQMFADLPSSLRKRFGNSPEEFLFFVDNPANRDEAIRLGLITPAEVSPASVSPAGDTSAGDKPVGASGAP